jgi:pimeloyl-ACP methyl ester carboxylesterase
VHSNRTMDGNSIELKKPSFFWFLTEGGRAFVEWSTLIPYQLIKKRSQKGDGHPVLVFPGFMASDTSTKPLRSFLDSIGYNSYGWDVGRNYGDPNTIEELTEMVEYLYRSHHKKVSIIGWSLGGIYARQVAKELPHITRQVITLGSPFAGLDKPNNAVWIYNLLTGGKGISQIDPDYLREIPQPAPIPTSAIYSKEDGVVPWQACLEIESEIHQNIRVRGSHFGLGVNPVVLQIIANRLQLSEKNWTKWAPKKDWAHSILYPHE